MSAPQVGDRIRYVIEAEVVAYRAGNRILGLVADDGRRWNLPYDARSLYPEHGVTIEILPELPNPHPVLAAQVTAHPPP